MHASPYRFLVVLVATLSSMATTSCSRPEVESPTNEARVARLDGQDALDDARVLGVLRSSGEAEITLANMTARLATSQRVASAARALAADHQALLDAQKTLEVRLGFSPSPSPQSREIDSDANKLIDALAHQRPGRGLDRSLVNAQIGVHERNIANLANLLLPEAASPTLVVWLRKYRTVEGAHLEEAKQLHEELPLLLRRAGHARAVAPGALACRARSLP